jgi:RimJ/RimL family protein N-acetyltransferase
MVELKSERLILSKFTKNDASFFYELVNDPAWKQYIGDRNVNTILAAKKYLEDNVIPSYDTFGFGFYIVRLKEDNTSIGMCGLIKRDWMDYVEIGYAFLAEYRGKGYAIESSIATKNYAKEKLNIPQIAAITNIDNEKSGILLNRLGLEFSKLISYPGENKKCRLYLEK